MIFRPTPHSTYRKKQTDDQDEADIKRLTHTLLEPTYYLLNLPTVPIYYLLYLPTVPTYFLLYLPTYLLQLGNFEIDGSEDCSLSAQCSVLNEQGGITGLWMINRGRWIGETIDENSRLHS